MAFEKGNGTDDEKLEDKSEGLIIEKDSLNNYNTLLSSSSSFLPALNACNTINFSIG
jgi:hypothetical protein